MFILSRVQVCLDFTTVNSLVCRHTQDFEKVSIGRAVRLQELFPYGDTKEKYRRYRLTEELQRYYGSSLII